MTNIHTLHRFLALLALISVPLSLVWGQQSAPAQTSGAAPAATVPEAQNPENPPLSGLDRPTTESPFVGRSFFIPGLQLDESVSSNAYGSSSGQGQRLTAISRGLGSLDLQKIWRRYQLDLDYVGGGSYYTGRNTPGISRGYQQHSLGVDQRILWRTGQLAIRDNFSYLPEGSFGFGSYGGFGGFSSALGGSGLSGVGLSSGLGGGLAGGVGGLGLYGGGTYGTIGVQPRIDNLTIVDITQGLSPRSTVTFGGGYDFNTYLNQSRSSFPLINAKQISGQIGYDRLLNRKDQIALVAAYQQLQFPGAGGGDIRAYSLQGVYGHRLNGRMNLVIGGGPQVLTRNTVFIRVGNLLVALPSSTTVGGTGSVSLGYTISARTDISLNYEHYITAGSGFYAGANTDAGRATVTHILSRNWNLSSDGGYSYSTPLQARLTSTGINAASYQYWYVGGSLRRRLGQHFDLFMTYQYDAFKAGSCTGSNGSRAVCGQTPAAHVGTIGLNWHPRPIRLD